MGPKGPKGKKQSNAAGKPQEGPPPASPPASAHHPTQQFTTPSLVLSIDTNEYRPQLDRKLEQLQSMFSSLPPEGEKLPELEVFESVPINYRMRAEFTCWGVKPKDGQEPDVHFIMYDSSSRIKPPPMIRVDEFPVGSKLMNELMTLVRQGVNRDPILRERLFQANFHTTQVGDSMVTLVYHKKLDDVWQESARKLRTLLAQAPSAHGYVPHVIGRSRKQKVELDQSHVVEQLTINGKTYASKQVEATFSQPNACMCEKMVTWAQNVTAGSYTPPSAALGADDSHAAPSTSSAAPAAPAAASAAPTAAGNSGEAAPTAEAAQGGSSHHQSAGAANEQDGAQGGAAGSSSGAAAAAPAAAAPAPAAAPSTSGADDTTCHDLLELYCGNGNFTIPLASNFRHVVATEVSKSGVEAAKWNMEANQVHNIFVARMSSEEFTEAWKSQAKKKRLEGLDWSQLSLRTVLVDPPRAGLDPGTVRLVSGFERIVYISCNPETLLRNLKDLMPTHKLSRFAAFDQFPYTHHLECGAYLVKRDQ